MASEEYINQPNPIRDRIDDLPEPVVARPGQAQPTYQEALRMAEEARQREGIKPYTEGQRFGYGLLWAFWTAVLVFAALSTGKAITALILLVLAFVAGRYDYKIWTYQARRLWFFIIF